MSADAERIEPPEGPRRQTFQRQSVRDCIESSESFLSAQQVFAQLRADGTRIGLATVYRNLQTMADAGEVDVLRGNDGELRYRKCGPAHHHHLVCRQCGRTVEIVGPAVERWATKMANEHGFTDVAHTVELFGLCPACSAAD